MTTDPLADATAPAFSVLLSSTPRGARLARLLAEEQLRSWGLPFDTACHLVAELAANAVSHGRVPGRDSRLTLRLLGDVLRIEISDTRDEHLPELQQAAPDAESGRGLLLVDALAHRWGVTEDGFPRKTVRANCVSRHRIPGSRVHNGAPPGPTDRCAGMLVSGTGPAGAAARRARAGRRECGVASVPVPDT